VWWAWGRKSYRIVGTRRGSFQEESSCILQCHSRDQDRRPHRTQLWSSCTRFPENNGHMSQDPLNQLALQDNLVSRWPTDLPFSHTECHIVTHHLSQWLCFVHGVWRDQPPRASQCIHSRQHCNLPTPGRMKQLHHPTLMAATPLLLEEHYVLRLRPQDWMARSQGKGLEETAMK